MKSNNEIKWWNQMMESNDEIKWKKLKFTYRNKSMNKDDYKYDDHLWLSDN